MVSNIFSYAINIHQVQEAMGSCDGKLYDEILDTDTFKLFSKGDIEGYITTQQAVKQIIFGETYDSKSPHAYGYAFIALCSCLGKKLPSAFKIRFGGEVDTFNDVLESDFNVKLIIEELLLKECESFSLPEVEDWPQIGLLNRNDLLILQSQFKNIHITDDMLVKLLTEDDKKTAYDNIRRLKENISFCIDNNLDLISFCH